MKRSRTTRLGRPKRFESLRLAPVLGVVRGVAIRSSRARGQELPASEVRSSPPLASFSRRSAIYGQCGLGRTTAPSAHRSRMVFTGFGLAHMRTMTRLSPNSALLPDAKLRRSALASARHNANVRSHGSPTARGSNEGYRALKCGRRT
jgi:hypothetical protein